MDESHDKGEDVSESSTKDAGYECKFCHEKFDNLQSVLKHELLNHTLDKTPKKSPANQLKRKVTAVLKTVNSKDEKESRQKLVEAITDCVEGSELNAIFNRYQLNNDDLRCIYSRVEACLQQELNKYGFYTIEPFGSITNGLALKSSDIDLHISTPQQVESHIVFRDITRMLYRSKFFTNVYPIRKAKVPIIKCVHSPTGFHLDINTSEPFGVHNSKFIRKLMACDPRIHQLMLFLKIWCKNMHINGAFNMTNYCLIALVIFYLQNNNPQILTSIQIMKHMVRKRFVNGISFEVNLRGMPLDKSQSTLELIKGFFAFYESFDFENCIISPYLGKTINRKLFDSGNFPIPEYENQLFSLAKNGEVERLRTDRPVCIQDSFCLYVNVGKTLTEANVQYLKTCLNFAHKKCSDPQISEKDLYKYLLVNLLDDVTKMDLGEELEIPKSDAEMSFVIIPRRNEVKSLAKFASEPLMLKKLWAKEYTDAVLQIVTDVYRVDMTPLSSTQSPKFKKIDETDKKAIPSALKWSISCYVDLWSGRQIQRTNTIPFMDYHLEQTEKLNAERRQDSNYAVQMKGTLTLKVLNNYEGLCVEVSSADAVCKKDKLRKFFNALKCITQNYNLKQRIYQLENQMNE